MGKFSVSTLEGIRKALLGSVVLCGALFSQTTCCGNDMQLEFWPGDIRISSPQQTGALFSWPEYEVILQTKTGPNAYAPAVISASEAARLSDTFRPSETSPILVTRNQEASTWGLSIRGGYQLSEKNAALVNPLVAGLMSCLSTLEAADLDKVKAVIYSPGSFVSPTENAKLTEEYKAIVSKMFGTYKANRCKDKTIEVPGLVQKQLQKYVEAMVTGNSANGPVLDGELLVLSQLFQEMLFSAKGLWVRTTLAIIQEHVRAVLEKNPLMNASGWLNENYSSFIRFVLATRQTSKLSAAQYVDVGRACGVSELSHVFGSFQLKECVNKGFVKVLRLTLGSTQGSIMIAGEPQ